MGEITGAPQVCPGRLRRRDSEDSDFKKSKDKVIETRKGKVI